MNLDLVMIYYEASLTEGEETENTMSIPQGVARWPLLTPPGLELRPVVWSPKKDI